MQGAQVQSLVRKLRSRMPHSLAKKKERVSQKSELPSGGGAISHPRELPFTEGSHAEAGNMKKFQRRLNAMPSKGTHSSKPSEFFESSNL